MLYKVVQLSNIIITFVDLQTTQSSDYNFQVILRTVYKVLEKQDLYFDSCIILVLYKLYNCLQKLICLLFF